MERLELLNCNIRDIGCRIFHNVVVKQNAPVTIDYINFSSNSLTLASAQYITEIVVHCKAKLLHLNGNVLGKTDGLSGMLQCSMLEEIYIHSSKLHTLSAVELFKVLKSGSQLKTLSLMHNDIQDEASIEIASMLQVNKSLKSLWINANPLSGEAVLTIVTSLRNNYSLQLLKIPRYSYEVRKLIIREVKSINQTRERLKCSVELTVDFQLQSYFNCIACQYNCLPCG